MSDIEGDKGLHPHIASHQAGIGLALGGGMARGLAHIGVLRVLERNGIRPSMVAGTSIGAVVGAAYLSGKMGELERWALSMNRLRMLSYLDFRVRSAGMIGGTRLRKILERNFDDMVIEDMPSPFVAIAADLITGHEVWLRKGSIIDALVASFALPGIFPPVERNHRLLIDGALVNPVPVSAVQAMGPRMTIGVDLNADIIGKAVKPGQAFPTVAGFDIFDSHDVPEAAQKKITSGLTKRLFKRQKNSPSMFGVMVSSLSIVQDRLTRSRLAGDPPDIHIKPKLGDIGLLEFEKAEELIARGEDAAEKVLPDIQDAMKVFLPGAAIV